VLADDGDNGGQAIHKAGAVENESAHAMPKLTEVQRFCSNAGAGASVEGERTLLCRPRPRRNNRTHFPDDVLLLRDRPSRIGKDKKARSRCRRLECDIERKLEVHSAPTVPRSKLALVRTKRRIQYEAGHADEGSREQR